MQTTSPRLPTLFLFLLVLVAFYQRTIADGYLHVSKGSNSRRLGDGMNHENDNRVFDSQNNDNEGLNAPDENINQAGNATKGRKLPPLFEGDIVLTPDVTDQIQEGGDIEQSSPDVTKRNAIRNRNGLWVTKIIPYELPEYLKAVLEGPVKAAIKEFHNKTCLMFVPRTTEKTWIRFVTKPGCWSRIGRSRSPGFQEVSLGPGCNRAGIAKHELMHAIGFWHEQSRPDRDKYVEILWENIRQGKEHNFNKYSHGRADILGTNYDFESVMHYSKFAFSKNVQATILAINKPERTLGQRIRLSDIDVIKINALYDCTDSASGVWSKWSEFSPCLSNCNKFRQRFCSSKDRAKDCPLADQYGIETETVKCSNKECYAPVDGHWGRWSSWSACNSSCGPGKKQRTRRCDDPAPNNGGKNCAGIKTHSRDCIYKKCSLGPDDCDFDNEAGWCIWHNVNRLWYLWSGNTTSSGTGPERDNGGLKEGRYIYFESSSPVQPGEQGIVESKIFAPTQATCMSFYFSMYGDTMGNLSVYVQDLDNLPLQSNGKIIWEKIGNQGNSWQYSNVTITSSTRFKIRFIATKGSRYRSDIALDDITFKNNPCLTLISTTKIPTISRRDDCDFDSGAGWCIWHNVDQLWYLQSGKTRSSGTGPERDNGGRKGGRYIYFESSSPVKPGQQGIVESNIFAPTQATCMSFYFSMYGDTMGNLRVYIQDLDNLPLQSNGKKIWEKIGNQGNSWHNRDVTITSSTRFKIRFIATKGSSYRSDIALDDITFKNKSCLTLINTTKIPTISRRDDCDFDSGAGWCIWNNVNKLWYLQSGKTRSSRTGPERDNGGLKGGRYIYFESSSPVQPGEQGIVESKIFAPTQATCMSFYFSMYGDTMGNLRVYIHDMDKLPLQSNGKIIWEKIGNQGNSWHYSNVTITSSTRFKIRFIATKGSSYRSDIALDDITFKNKPCLTLINTTKIPTISRRDDCDFDSGAGWCIWNNVNRLWYLQSGKTRSSRTGPERDNGGLKGGRYIYFESSSPVKSGEQGIVESNIFAPTQATCMSFYFSMYGDTMGNLRVHIQDMDKLALQSNGKKNWEKIGNQGNSWHYSNVTIISSTRFKILFIATKGSSYRSDIGLDDITFINKPCFPTISRRDDCDFDSGAGWCIWNNVNKLWYLQSGKTRSSRTGPERDNGGLKGGRYIYFESSLPVKTGERGTVESKIFAPTQATCMSFSFSMYGDTMGNLRVYIQDMDKLPLQSNGKKIWEKIGNLGKSWHDSRVTITSSTRFKILFIATKGSSYRSDIALDDVSFKNQAC